MNGHLSPKQFSEWIMGEREPEIAAHLRACEACTSDVENVIGAINTFREAVCDRGFRSSDRSHPLHARNHFSAWKATALACVAVLALLALGRQVMRTKAAPLAQQVQASREPDALLIRIEGQTSRIVPVSLDPLFNAPSNHE